MTLRYYAAVVTVFTGSFCALLVAQLVLLAYINGGRIVVYTNRLGEARFELYLLFVILSLFPLGWYELDRRLRHRMDE